MWTCKNCNEQLEEQFDTCWNCGYEKESQNKAVNEVKEKENRSFETAKKDVMDNAQVRNQMNKVVTVDLTGGLIGLFTCSPVKELNKSIKCENDNGWKVVQVIFAKHFNFLEIVVSVLMLVVTLFLYTKISGFYIVLERKK